VQTTFAYPYYSVNGFPQPWSFQFWRLCALESIFLIDIILNFFLQELDEENKSRNHPLEVVAQKYFTSRFPIDFIILLPLGGILSLIDIRLKFFWLIKALRIKDLMKYL